MLAARLRLTGALGALALVAISAALPGARATTVPTLAVPQACLNSAPGGRQTFAVYGSGFPANVTMYVGFVSDYPNEVVTTTDAAGNLAVRLQASPAWSARPTTETIQALEPSTQHPPQVLATLRVPAVARGATLALTPATLLTAVHTRVHGVLGGMPGHSLYIHWLRFPSHHARYARPVRTVRVGALLGPCGAREVTFLMLGGVRVRPGEWVVGIDANRHQNRRFDGPNAGVALEVRSWDGRGAPPIPHLRRGGYYVVVI